MIEKWKVIDGYEGVYEVSNTGKIFRKIACRKAKSRLIGHISPKGYGFVVLSKNKVKSKYPIHRLIAKYFIGNPPKNKYSINHKDGNKLNNAVSNLEYCSQKENTRHAIKKGLFKNKGVDHWKSKLSEKDIKDIRKIYKTGQISQTKLSKRYKVTQPAIYNIINKKIWRHVK